MNKLRRPSKADENILLALFRRLSPAEQHRFLESLDARLRIEKYRESGLILSASELETAETAAGHRQIPQADRD